MHTMTISEDPTQVFIGGKMIIVGVKKVPVSNDDTINDDHQYEIVAHMSRNR